MEHSSNVLLELFLLFAAAKLMAEIFERFRQPAVIGEILAGVLLGPHLLGVVAPSELTSGIAEIGVIVLLFTVGLETRPRELLRVGRVAVQVAVLGVVFPFLGAFIYMYLTKHSSLESVFMGTALVATSVGITARIMADMNVLDSNVARVILGAAVIDDVLGMILLAVVSASSRGNVNYLSIGLVVLEALAFTVVMVFWGGRVVKRITPRISSMYSRNPAFIISLIACLGLSAAASYIGMAAIIGAFLAGLAIAEQREAWDIGEKTQALNELLVPFFFAILGMQLNLKTFLDGSIMVTATVITVIAILTKLLGCWLGAFKMGRMNGIRVGFGMVPRGEVGMIVAQVGLMLNTISDAVYSEVLIMTVVTTLFTPPILRALFKGMQTTTQSKNNRSKGGRKFTLPSQQ